MLSARRQRPAEARLRSRGAASTRRRRRAAPPHCEGLDGHSRPRRSARERGRADARPRRRHTAAPRQ
eukprot:15202140-Heterocapsa_arctica.AAC.1